MDNISKEKGPIVPDDKEPVRDSVSGLTHAQSLAFDEFVYGDGYDLDPLRRWVRDRGGHCSGGGGPC